MTNRWTWLPLLAVCIAAIYLGTVANSGRDVALFERLARKIERAAVLSPESTSALTRMVDGARQRAAAGAGDRYGKRREVAIERLATIVKAKTSIQDVSSVAQPTGD